MMLKAALHAARLLHVRKDLPCRYWVAADAAPE